MRILPTILRNVVCKSVILELRTPSGHYILPTPERDIGEKTRDTAASRELLFEF